MSEEIRELVKLGEVRNYTGQRIARLRPRAYRKAIGMLAAGASVNAVCEACAMDFRSVVAIRENEATSITERKNSLSSLAFRIASGAGETIENDIAAGKLHGSAAVVAFGVATDKLLALSDQPTARLAIDVSGSVDIVARFAEVTDAIKAAVARPISPPVLLEPPDPDPDPGQ